MNPSANMTRPQVASFVAAWSGWVLDAFDFAIFGLVMKQISNELDVGLLALSGSITLTLLVRLAGGSVAGWMADRWGRKLPLILSMVWFVSFDAAIYFSHTFQAILVFRTLFGFGMGAQWTAGTALAMESVPDHRRKIASGLLQAGWPIGVLLAGATAYFVVPAWGWRPMFLLASIPALLTLPLWFFVPNIKPVPRDQTIQRSAVRELTAPGVMRMIVLASIVMALGFVVYYGLTTQYALMLQTTLHLSAQATFLHVIVFNAGMLVGVICAGIVANRWGVIAALCIPALLMVPALPLYVGFAPDLLWVGAFLGGMLGVGYSGVTPVLTTSLFPDHIRARAIGIVYHAGALIAAFVPALVATLSSEHILSLPMAIMVVCGIGLVGMAGAVFLLRHRIAPMTHVGAATRTARSTSVEAHLVALDLANLDVARGSQPVELEQ